MSGLTAIMYFVNDRGESIAERGASSLRFSTRGRTFVRYLALVGAANLIVLGYNLFLDVWQVNVGSWPKAVQERSYFVNGMCGYGTTYPCPSAQQAIAVRGASAHIGRDGPAVIPAGTDIEKLRIVPFATEAR